MRRSCEIDESSAERKRSLSAAAWRFGRIPDEQRALDGDRRLVEERLDDALIFGRQRLASPGRTPMTPTMPRDVRNGRNAILRIGQASSS